MIDDLVNLNWVYTVRDLDLDLEVWIRFGLVWFGG